MSGNKNRNKNGSKNINVTNSTNDNSTTNNNTSSTNNIITDSSNNTAKYYNYITYFIVFIPIILFLLKAIYTHFKDTSYSQYKIIKSIIIYKYELTSIFVLVAFIFCIYYLYKLHDKAELKLYLGDIKCLVGTTLAAIYISYYTLIVSEFKDIITNFILLITALFFISDGLSDMDDFLEKIKNNNIRATIKKLNRRRLILSLINFIIGIALYIFMLQWLFDKSAHDAKFIIITLIITLIYVFVYSIMLPITSEILSTIYWLESLDSSVISHSNIKNRVIKNLSKHYSDKKYYFIIFILFALIATILYLIFMFSIITTFIILAILWVIHNRGRKILLKWIL